MINVEVESQLAASARPGIWLEDLWILWLHDRPDQAPEISTSTRGACDRRPRLQCGPETSSWAGTVSASASSEDCAKTRYGWFFMPPLPKSIFHNGSAECYLG